MGDVCVAAIQELKALPEDVHWFCSRGPTNDDADRCYDEDFTVQELAAESEDDKQARQARAAAAMKRKDTVLSAVQIFAFDGPEAIPLQRWVQEKLDSLMRDCDICVRTYHAARFDLKQKLDADYDPEEVAAFLDRFDGINVERIKAGLQSAERQLLHLAPDKRRVGSLAPEGLYALFEAMNCEPYLRNEQLMRTTFDEPFRLIQTNKKLRLATYLPAFTYFIFSDVPERLQWADFAWGKMARPPTTHEFDYMIRKPLELALRRVQVQALEVHFLPTFWYGMSTIASKISGELIMHSLRPMEANVLRLTIDNFSLKEIDVVRFGYLTSTFKDLLEKSPDAFWDAMRSITPKAIVEQCFRSPAMNEILTRPSDEGTPRMEDIFSWIQPFTASIRGNPVSACGALMREFVQRSKNDHFDRVARAYCFTLALHVLDQTIKSLRTPKTFDSYVGSAVVAEMLELVTEYLPSVLEQARGVKNQAQSYDSEDVTTSLSIVENAIALDVLTLLMDKKSVQFHKPRGHTASKNSKAFWERLTGGVASSDQAIVTRVLLGARELVTIEKFNAKFEPREPNDARSFGDAYDDRCASLSDFLERLSEFNQYQLAGLFKTPETASSIIHMLFSSDRGVHAAALEVLKSISQKTEREEAILHVLDSAFRNFILAFTKSTRDIAAKNVYTPMPGIIKVGTDMMDALCNPSNGLLRVRNLTQVEVDATKDFWAALWSTLTTIFMQMENWGMLGYDKNAMMTFCQDTMQFADSIFDQYSVFLNVLQEDYDEEKQRKEKAKELLQHPRNAMETMVKWLRLKDEFLIEKILTLITSLLARLSKNRVSASTATLDFVETVVNKKTRTALRPTQLALLQDSLGKYSNRTIARQQVEDRRKAEKQTSLKDWTSQGPGRTRDDAIDLESSDASSVQDREKDTGKKADRLKQLKEQQTGKKLPSARAVPEKKKNLLDANMFLKKRKMEEEEAKKKRAAAAAQARGNIPGAGSAINSLGLATKDHSMKGQGVMVDSDESSSGSDSDESDSDQNDLDRELFGPSKKSSKAANAMSEKEAKKLLPAGPVKVKKVQRSAKDMRARLAPDLGKLHQDILSWDYFHQGYYPPNRDAQHYAPVPTKVDTATEYVKIFSPLLVLETWRKICNDKDQESSNKPYEVKVITRSSVDAFFEVNTSMPPLTGDQRPEVFEGDLVLLSTANNPREACDSPSCLARIHKISRKKQHIEVLYRVMPGNKLMSHLNGGTNIRALKIESLITVEREYGALVGLQYYDLNEYILQAAPSKLLQYKEDLLVPLMRNYKLNQAQAKAVQSALDNDAFTLIQGPPGSGKTKTIVATVGALLSNTFKNANAPGGRPGMQNGATSVSTANSKKLLVCAPSNAAVDELVLRFKEGIRTTAGQDRKINVVRLGRSEKINQQVLEVTLEELVAARLNKAAGNSEIQRLETQKLMMEHKDISQKLNTMHEQRDALEAKNESVMPIMEELNGLRKRKKELSLLIDQAKDKEQNQSRQNDLERKRVEQQILDEAHILCATLSASGHERFQNLSLEFETVIVDEAAQCTELQALIPLKYGAAKCILVGDPKQLPPTTFMDSKLNFQYEQSLFVRMQNNSPQDVHLLDTQYRMHPEISSFPSKCFYESRLLDGADMDKLRAKPWHKDSMLGPYRFFDVHGQQNFTGSSLTNKMEIDAAMRLYNKLTASCSSYDFRGKIGIITPYKAQFNAMKRCFQEKFGNSILDTIEFNTTDAFQGRECEIIIFSCVRASEGSIGFLSDYRRMNVGLTRAKCSLWVLGNTKSLMNGKYWRAMIEDAQKRNRLSPVADIGKSKLTSAQAPYQPSQDHSSILNYGDDDVSMAGSSGLDSLGASRRSSTGSVANGLPKDRVIKQENHGRVKNEPRDVEMKDILFSDDQSVKFENYHNTIKKENARKESKHEINKPLPEQRVQAPAPPPKKYGSGSGVLVPPPRAPAQMPVKRKKPQANGALLDSKRPKKH